MAIEKCGATCGMACATPCILYAEHAGPHSWETENEYLLRVMPDEAPAIEAGIDAVRRVLGEAATVVVPWPEGEPERDAVDALLDERTATHGSFIATSYAFNPEDPFAYAETGIRMKLARIESGDAGLDEHWRDIEGYARGAREVASELRKVRGV
jgi:hypothetical protein